ncbi:MAG: ribonuclease D, partial [bacterium]|nr:ribonuclease D [bacterium]
MPLPELDPPILVEDEIELERLLEDLEKQDEIAVDTEADSFYSYREKVCLIQVTVEDRDYLVDPLAGLDLTPFGDVIADPSKTKVFHDAEYDVLIMKRVLGWSFAGLFDTRVAAAVIGMEAPGLASVLEDRFGVELDKSMQRSNWAKRPLEERQIQYARLDTHYLLPLMADLRRLLEERGRSMIVEAECRRLEQLEPAPITFN